MKLTLLKKKRKHEQISCLKTNLLLHQLFQAIKCHHKVKIFVFRFKQKKKIIKNGRKKRKKRKYTFNLGEKGEKGEKKNDKTTEQHGN